MSAALTNALLVVGFLTVYLMAGEVLLGARRQRRRRHAHGPHGAHVLDDPHWMLSPAEVLPRLDDEPGAMLGEHQSTRAA
jgi:hypothetical protein